MFGRDESLERNSNINSSSYSSEDVSTNEGSELLLANTRMTAGFQADPEVKQRATRKKASVETFLLLKI